MLFYGGYWSGTVPVPVNVRLAPPEMRDVLEDAGVKILFLDTAFQALRKEEALAPWRESTVLVRTPNAEESSFEARSARAEAGPMHPGRWSLGPPCRISIACAMEG